MAYKTKTVKYEVWLVRFLGIGVVTALAGCAGSVAAYHRYEGGVIAQNPPPPPGLDEPYGNLASVPKRPPELPLAVQQSVRASLEAANARQHKLPAPAGGEATKAKPTAPPAAIAPVLLGFAPDSAILHRDDRAKLASLAAHRGDHAIRAAGFAPGRDAASLRLALQRATAIANALTLAGVPPAAIRLAALTGARGGAAQLIYAPEPKSGTPNEDQK